MSAVAAAGASAGADLLKTLLQMEIERDAAERKRIEEMQEAMRKRQQEAFETQAAQPVQAAGREVDALQRIINIFQNGRR